MVLEHDAPPEVPTEFAAVFGDLCEARRSLLMIYPTVFGERGPEESRQMLAVQGEADHEFGHLSEDADDATIDQIARRMLPAVRDVRGERPWAADPTVDSPLSAREAAATIGHAMVELYRPAQLRLLRRLDTLLTQDDGSAEE